MSDVSALILEARVMASDCYPATAKLLTRLADALEASTELLGALLGVVESSIEHDDARMDYVLMQIDRVDLEFARRAMLERIV